MDEVVDSINVYSNPDTSREQAEHPTNPNEVTTQKSTPRPRTPSSFLHCALHKAMHRSDSGLNFRTTKKAIQANVTQSPECFPTMRMIVKGSSQCGKTSLAMDVAHSIAGSTSAAAIVFLIPERKRSLIDFPLSCRGEYSFLRNAATQEVGFVGAGLIDEDNIHDQFLENMKGMDVQYNAEQEGTGNPQVYSTPLSRWDERAGNLSNDPLQRIHIIYIKTTQDLIQTLANIQHNGLTDASTDMNEYDTMESDDESECLNRDAQRVNAIVVDDLDCYVIDEAMSTTRTDRGQGREMNLHDMKLIQLLAILSDTCNYLDEANNANRINPDQKTHLVVCLNTDRMHLSKVIYPLIQNYTSTIVSIEKNDLVGMDTSIIGQHEKQPRFLSGWTMSVQHADLTHPLLVPEYDLRTNFMIGKPCRKYAYGDETNDATMGTNEARGRYDDENDEFELYWKL